MIAVTDVPFTETDRRVSPDEARQWIRGGTQVLPAEIAARPWSTQFHCTALIYEFVREQDAEPRVVLPAEGALDALAHLRGARLWGARLATVFGPG